MILSPTDTLHMRAVATMLDSYASAFPERRTAHLAAWAKDLASEDGGRVPAAQAGAEGST